MSNPIYTDNSAAQRALDADLYNTQQQAPEHENVAGTGNLNIGLVIDYDVRAERQLHGRIIDADPGQVPTDHDFAVPPVQNLSENAHSDNAPVLQTASTFAAPQAAGYTGLETAARPADYALAASPAGGPAIADNAAAALPAPGESTASRLSSSGQTSVTTTDDHKTVNSYNTYNEVTTYNETNSTTYIYNDGSGDGQAGEGHNTYVVNNYNIGSREVVLRQKLMEQLMDFRQLFASEQQEEMIAFAAHALKSASAAMGYPQLAALMSAIESASRFMPATLVNNRQLLQYFLQQITL